MMKKSWKLSEREKEKIKHLRAEGWKIRELAEAFEVCGSTIQYVCHPEYKEVTRKRTIRWMKAHPRKYNMQKRKWRKEHHDRIYPSICLSLMKKCLREGWLEKEKILKTIQEAEK